jgi:hypothetical protein
MPCYDKKLEASRSDFYDDILKSKEVDCVLATTEIVDIIREEKIDFASLPESNLDTLYVCPSLFHCVYFISFIVLLFPYFIYFFLFLQIYEH